MRCNTTESPPRSFADSAAAALVASGRGGRCGGRCRPGHSQWGHSKQDRDAHCLQQLPLITGRRPMAQWSHAWWPLHNEIWINCQSTSRVQAQDTTKSQSALLCPSSVQSPVPHVCSALAGSHSSCLLQRLLMPGRSCHACCRGCSCLADPAMH